MKNKQTIFKIKELSSNIKAITGNLSEEKELNKSDILTICDLLDEIQQISQRIHDKSGNIFMKASAQNIRGDVKTLYGRIEEIENNRQLEDEEILGRLHEMSYREDYLELNFFSLNPYDIEIILACLEEEIEEASRQKPFDEQVIGPLMDRVKRKFSDLRFRHEFPIVEELDENKDSYARRLVLRANEIKQKNPRKARLLINKVDELMDLVWLSKMFIFGNFERASSLFEKINPKLKEKIRQIIWRVKGEDLNKLQDKKWILPAALMNHVADEINA